MSKLTRQEKVQIMYDRFGKDVLHLCRDCCHRIVREYSGRYAKCECFSTSHCETTDWGSLQSACGLFNKETDVRDVFKHSDEYGRKPKAELQPETLF